MSCESTAANWKEENCAPLSLHDRQNRQLRVDRSFRPNTIQSEGRLSASSHLTGTRPPSKFSPQARPQNRHTQASSLLSSPFLSLAPRTPRVGVVTEQHTFLSLHSASLIASFFPPAARKSSQAHQYFLTHHHRHAIMTNAPNRFDLFILGPDEKRVEIVEDTKIPNAATFWFNKEDHTLGNMLRHAVLANPAVLFCGYKVPHPLEPKMFVKIQTDGSLTPTDALKQGSQKLIAQISSLKGAWRTEVQMSGAGTVDVGGFGRSDQYDAQAYGGEGAGGYVDI